MKDHFHRPTLSNPGYFFLGILAAIIIFGLINGAFTSKAHAAVVCDVELSAGVGLADNQLSEDGSKIDLAQKGALAGAGAGCDLVGPQSFGGLMARYSVMHLSGKLNDGVTEASLTSDGLFEIAGRVGYRFTEKSSAYVLAGWAWTNLDIKAADFKNHPNGPMLGAGLEHQIGNGPWAIRGEYTWHHFGSQMVEGTKLEPDLHVVRAAVVFKFGEMPNLLDESKPAAKAKKVAP